MQTHISIPYRLFLSSALFLILWMALLAAPVLAAGDKDLLSLLNEGFSGRVARYIAAAVGGLFLLMILIAAWSWMLQRQVRERMAMFEAQRIRLEVALQAANDVIWDWDVVNDRQKWNEAGTLTFGWEDIVNEYQAAAWWHDRVHPGDAERVREKFDTILKDPETQRWEEEYRFLKKDGTFACVYDRGYVIRDADGAPVRMIGAMQDITALTIRERISTVRRQMAELAVTATVPELMQAFLDEAEEITDSEIGFFHDVEPGEDAVVLRAWSTRTLKTCNAGESGSCYPVSKAGVWLDCLHRREPVIHNQYAALPHKKGLPDRHVAVVREAVLPIFRDQKIVAVFGVGNKPSDYTQADIDTLAALSDAVWNIIEQCRFQDTIDHHRHLLETVFNSAPGFLILKDRNSIYQAVNPSFCNFVGRSEKEIIGRTDHDLFPESEAMAYIKGDSAVMATGRTEKEDWQVTGKNKKQWLHVIKTAVYDKTGQPSGVLCSVLDITARKLAEQEKSHLTAAIEQAAETIVITDASALITYANPAFERLTGYPVEQALGKNPRILQSGRHDAAFYKQMWDTLTGGKTWTGRFINKKMDGTLFTEDASISPLKDADGTISGYVAVKHDVTQTLAMEDQLTQARKVEAVGRLAGGVAHDLNNLLMPILGFSEMMMQDIPPDDKDYQALKIIYNSGARARDLVRQLLAFSRKQPITLSVSNINQIIRNFESLLSRTIRENITIHTLLSKDLLPVLADPGQIEQILLNLSINAQDAMPDGGHLTIETGMTDLDKASAARHQGVTPGTFVMLAVSDTGCGMDEAVQTNIFDPFFTTKGKDGTGLGLSTVYGVVKQHHGNIWVYSEPGRGTIFKIYLPVTRKPEEEQKQAIIENSGSTGTETILVVEDTIEILDLIRTVLNRTGYTVLTADCSASALDILASRKEKIDLLLTDVIMPGMNGRQLHENALKHLPGLKVIYMSGYTDNVIAHHGIMEKGIEFLQKPFRAADLVHKIRKVLDKKPSRPRDLI